MATYKLHPLALCVISDHYTRSSLNDEATSYPSVQAGALLGKAEGQFVSIVTAFEGNIDGDNRLDNNLLETRRSQHEQTDPDLHIIGVYIAGNGLSGRVDGSSSPQGGRHAPLLTQFAEMGESPIMLVFDGGEAREEGDGESLPVQIFKAEDSKGQLKEAKFEVVAKEAESIAVDEATSVAESRSTPRTTELASHLNGALSSVDMLIKRVRPIIEAVDRGGENTSREILRKAQELLSLLESGKEEGEAGTPGSIRELESNEGEASMLTSMLSHMTRASCEASELVNALSIVNHASSMGPLRNRSQRKR